MQLRNHLISCLYHMVESLPLSASILRENYICLEAHAYTYFFYEKLHIRNSTLRSITQGAICFHIQNYWDIFTLFHLFPVSYYSECTQVMSECRKVFINSEYLKSDDFKKLSVLA